MAPRLVKIVAQLSFVRAYRSVRVEPYPMTRDAWEWNYSAIPVGNPRDHESERGQSFLVGPEALVG